MASVCYGHYFNWQVRLLFPLAVAFAFNSPAQAQGLAPALGNAFRFANETAASADPELLLQLARIYLDTPVVCPILAPLTFHANAHRRR